MKLYLTSYRIPDVQVLADLVGKAPGKTNTAIIPNAKDYYAPRAKAYKIRQVQAAIKLSGYRSDVVDLVDYTDGAKLAKVLGGYDLLYVMGGNTFCLREAMRQSGFDKVIREVLDGGVVYAGESAGACVAGTELHDVELFDNAEFAEKVIWRGLNLIPHYLLPHADNPDFGPTAQEVIAKRADQSNVVILNDNQAWVVRGGDAWKVTGSMPVAPE